MKTDFQPNEVLMAEDLNANFQECAGKADGNHTHTKSQITDFVHTHGMGDINGLSTEISKITPILSAYIDSLFKGNNGAYIIDDDSHIYYRVSEGHYKWEFYSEATGEDVTVELWSWIDMNNRLVYATMEGDKYLPYSEFTPNPSISPEYNYLAWINKLNTDGLPIMSRGEGSSGFLNAEGLKRFYTWMNRTKVDQYYFFASKPYGSDELTGLNSYTVCGVYLGRLELTNSHGDTTGILGAMLTVSFPDSDDGSETIKQILQSELDIYMRESDDGGSTWNNWTKSTIQTV